MKNRPLALRQELVFDMNTPEQNVEQTAEHEGFIKTPKQLITIIVLAFVVPIAVISLLIRLVIASSPLGVGTDAQSQEAVAKRIQPVAGFALVSADAAAQERTGEQIFSATCSACHTAGVAGAPKLGDSAAWGPLIAKGFDALVKNAINGLNAMPPRGGNPNLSDVEVARAVAYMANQGGANFTEPSSAEGEGEAASSEPAAQAEQPAAAPQAAAAPAAEAAPAAAPAAEAPKAEAAAPAANVDLAAGEKLYKSACLACHTTGVAGAPKLGDKAAWEPLIAQGMDEMICIAIEGKGAMPPRGASTASDEQIAAAVHYMVSQVK